MITGLNLLRLIIYLFELIISNTCTVRKLFGDTDVLISNGDMTHKYLKHYCLEMD